jgi:Tfp pilus assembly protein PilX
MGPCTISYLICKEKGKVNLMKGNPWLKNEDGTVLVVALIILVFLTLIGIAITATVEVEIQIAGNERLYKENLYNAEGASMECAQRMEQEASLDSSVHTWIKSMGTVTVDNIRDDAYWAANGTAVDPSVEPDGNTLYLAVEEGVAEGTTLDMTKTTLRSYAVYGRRYNPAQPNLGRSIVRVGYRRAE